MEQQPFSRSWVCLRRLSRAHIYSADAVSGVAATRCHHTLAPRQTALWCGAALSLCHA